MEEKLPDLLNGATDATPLAIFWAPTSPGCISVAFFLTLSKIPYKSYLMKGEGGDEENRADPRFWKLNPDRTLPALLDGDLLLTSPNAIMRYLAQQHKIDDVWWSLELKKQARMNSALDWSLWVLRKAAKDLLTSYELNRATIIDEFWGTNAGPGRAHAGKPNGMMSAVARLQALWLTKREYAAGRQRLTIVDLCLWADFSYIFSVFHMQEVVTPVKYPKLFAWQERVKTALQGTDALALWEAHLARRGEHVPQPPPCPPNLELPWKDYK